MNIRPLLEDMVSTESVYPEERELMEYLEGLLETNGFEIRRVPVSEDRFCLVAERGDPDIGFYGHVDTVPVQGDWERDPFEPEVEEGRLYGLGSFDMKGGIASFLSAAIESDEDVMILLGVDEELYSRGAYALRSGVDLSDLEALVVPEIADSSQDMEFPSAILGRRGRAVVDIEVDGESAHGATPDEGESAVERSLEVVETLQDLELRSHPELGDETAFFRRIESSTGSLSIPENAELELDVHLVPPSDARSFLERVREYLPEYASAELGERPNPYLEAYSTERAEVEHLLRSTETEFDIGYGLSVADENVFGQELPVLVVGPRGGNPHAADEWVDLHSLEQLKQIFIDFLNA